MPVRPRRRLARVLLAAALPVIVTARLAPAATIRDDRDPALYTVLGADPAYQSVGYMEVDEKLEPLPASGSGTLIAPNWVLTAAHVVDDVSAVRFTIGGQTYAGKRWAANQKYDGSTINGFTTEQKGYDIALVELDRPVTNVVPATLYRGKRELGLTATFVGFGKTGTGLTGDVTDDKVKRAVTNVIDGRAYRDRRDIWRTTPKLKSTYRTFDADFDKPNDPQFSRTGSPAPTDLEGLIAHGDSGGGVFIDDPRDDQGTVLAGVTSFGFFGDNLEDASYGEVSGHTRVRSFAKWIDKVIGNERYQRKLNWQEPSTTTAGLDLERLGAADLLRTGSGRLAYGTLSEPLYGPVPMYGPGVDAVPEPGTVGLLGAGAAGLLARRRRFRREPRA